jgi:predicted nucleic acid-binding protein
MIQDAFWDSSILVPLCVNQPPFTKIARVLVSTYTMNVWWGTDVEVVGAFTRLLRFGGLSNSQFLDAKVQAERLASKWFTVQPSDAIKSRARQLLERYPLRAADSLQLAAALEWCEDRPNGQLFLTADRRLSEAAEQVGFTLQAGLIFP